MSTPLYMLKLEPRMEKLAAWSYARHLAGRDGDLGYALHAALAAAFGPQAPKPFRLREPRLPDRGDGRDLPALYGYCAADEDELRQIAALAEPDVYAALGLDALAVKPMSTTWAAGRSLDFEVRIRPVIRCHQTGDRTRSRERDAFLAALPPGPRNDENEPVDREGVYRHWLERELARDGAARALPERMRMTAFRRTRVHRRGRADECGKRPSSEREGPDAIFTGTLQITDGPAFAALVRRGIGRHRAFGFGMLLLRPAGGEARTARC